MLHCRGLQDVIDVLHCGRALQDARHVGFPHRMPDTQACAPSNQGCVERAARCREERRMLCCLSVCCAAALTTCCAVLLVSVLCSGLDHMLCCLSVCCAACLSVLCCLSVCCAACLSVCCAAALTTRTVRHTRTCAADYFWPAHLAHAVGLAVLSITHVREALALIPRLHHRLGRVVLVARESAVVVDQELRGRRRPG